VRTVAIVVAAGKGKRMGLVDKPFLLLGKRPLLTYGLLTLENSSFIDKIILVVRKNKISKAKELIKKYHISKVKEIVAGGKTRQDSVVSGLKKTNSFADFVLIQDGARPFLTGELIKGVVLGAKRYKAAVPGLPLSDTTKEVENSSFISSTLSRKSLWTVQTPQVFKAEIIQKAYFQAEKNHFWGTDSASLVERIGIPVKIIKGDLYNIKITTKDDFLLAEAILKILPHSNPPPRVGREEGGGRKK